MLIPVRCFTCGKVLADKWEKYQEKCQELENKPKTLSEHKFIIDVSKKQILDDLELDRYCCRRVMIGHVDIIDHL